MLLAYNISTHINNKLLTIEKLRQKILLTPIPPEQELKLKWDFLINKVFWSMSLSGSPLSQQKVRKILSSTPFPLRPKTNEKDVINYKNALDYIKENWTITPEAINPGLVERLCYLAVSKNPKFYKLKSKPKRELKLTFDYLENGSDNPVIQAGVAHIRLITIKPYEDGNGRLARLLGQLYLHKFGYDFRGFLDVSEFLRRDVLKLEQVTASAIKRENLTVWLEYYAEGIDMQLRKAVQKIKDVQTYQLKPETNSKLTDRQKALLAFLENPNNTITNQKVRKMFKVSAITASRDLAKLANLNLIFKRGKGRSIYYSRV